MALKQATQRHASLNLFGKSAIVVGGTSGIGEGIAYRLAKANVSVTIIGRSVERGNKILEKLNNFSSNKDVRHNFIPLDCTLLSNIKTLASSSSSTPSISKDESSSSSSNSKLPETIDYLVLSQGIASMNGRTETSEKIDQKLSLHYFSRVAFVYALMPSLLKSSDPRVLSVLSAGVHGEYKNANDDPELIKNFNLKNAADAAGMYNDIAMEQLSSEFKSVAFTHAAPGIVNTNWGTDLPWYFRGPIRLIQPLFKSIDDCGELLSSALFDDEYKCKNDGKSWFLSDQEGKQIKPRDFSKYSKTVWDTTLAILKRTGILSQ